MDSVSIILTVSDSDLDNEEVLASVSVISTVSDNDLVNEEAVDT